MIAGNQPWRLLVGVVVALGASALLSGPACSSSSESSPPSASALAGSHAGGHAGAGTLGQAGNGGAVGGKGGTAGQSAAGTSPFCSEDEPEWLCHPDLWKPVKIPGSCELHELDLSKKPLPRRTWKECGEGCQESDLTLSFASGTKFTAHGGTVGGETYLRSTMAWPDWGKGAMTTVHRLSDGETVAAVLSAGAGCVSSRYALAYDVLSLMGDHGISTIGRFLPDDHSIRWFNYTFDGTGMFATFSLDDTIGFAAKSAGVGLLSHVDDQVPTFIEKGTYTPTAAGQGQLAIWPQHDSSGSRIRGFDWPGVITTLVETPGLHIPVVAISEKQLAWIAVQGPHALEGGYDTAELDWAKRPAEKPWPPAKNPVVQLGSKLPATSGLLNLRVGGGYAASVGCSEEYESMKQCRVMVVHLETGKLWEIFPRDGKGWGNVLDVNETKLLLSEADEENFGKARYDRILWLDLDKLDQHAARWKL